MNCFEQENDQIVADDTLIEDIVQRLISGNAMSPVRCIAEKNSSLLVEAGRTQLGPVLQRTKISEEGGVSLGEK